MADYPLVSLPVALLVTLRSIEEQGSKQCWGSRTEVLMFTRRLVTVTRSIANFGTIIARGNLAPPTQ